MPATISTAKLLTALRIRRTTKKAQMAKDAAKYWADRVTTLTKELAEAKLKVKTKATKPYYSSGATPDLDEAIATLELLDLTEIPLNSKDFAKYLRLL